MLNETKKAYKEIFEVLDKYEGIHNINIEDLKSRSKKHLFGLELKEKYGLNIDVLQIYPYSLDWIKINEHVRIMKFNKSNGRTISFPDDGKQPNDETLIAFSFPIGAYTFGDHYPEELFYDFFEELKEYKPKYVDTANKALYFTLENSKNVYNNFNSILNKYKKLDKEKSKLQRIEQLKKK